MERKLVLAGVYALSATALIVGFFQRNTDMKPATLAAATVSKDQRLCEEQNNEQVLFVSCGGFY
jgi:hypothetical protein